MPDDRDLASLTSKVAELDKDVAIIKTEMYGMHVQITDIKEDVKASRCLTQDTKDRVISIESQAKGAYRLLVVAQILLAMLIAAGFWAAR